jgi:fatty acid desaturase
MSLAVDARLRDRSEAFGREIVALGESLRQAAGPADLRHLRRIDVIGRVCGFAGLGTAWLCPNPLSAGLLAVSMMVRFVIGHQVGHGSYDRIDGVPARYTRKVFARGWRCYVDWLDWWRHEDWLFTHHQLHHANTQTPVDTDVMDSRFVAGRPYWVRVMWLAVMMASWKFTYYPPRL